MTTQCTDRLSDVNVNIYSDGENNWYFALWCGGEYDTNGQIDDVESADEAIAWASSQWPGATVQQVAAVA